MTIKLANRVQKIKPSATLTLAAQANKLKAEGRDIISLTVGEPDFNTPEHIKKAAIAAINDNFSRYTAVPGIPSLRKAIAEKIRNDLKIDYPENQIVVAAGAKSAIYNALQALIDPGDEVIIPAPYWVSYPDMVLLADGEPVTVVCDLKQNFKITATQLEAAITPATRALILNSPSNPTGVAYSKEDLLQLAQVLLKYPAITIISDDIYECILWNHTPFSNILSVCPELYDRTIIINGVSKTYAMTGWRIGYAAGPKPLIKAMENIQSQSTSCANSMAQKAALAAITGDQICVKEMVKEFKKRHDYLVAALNEIDGISVSAADGAFYLFPDIKEGMKKLGYANDLDFAAALLNEAEVAVVPGSPFGLPGYLRLSYATSMGELIKAVARIKKFMSRI